MHPGSESDIERIYQCAGFTRGAFYSNFDDKVELLLDLVRELEERLDGMVGGALSEHVEDFA